MSDELFRGYAEEAGLVVIAQNIINWGKDPDLDCVSLVGKP